MDICRLDPFATSPCWTVNAVFGSVFLVFLVPFFLELGIEKLLDVFQRNVVLGAASGRHMLRIRDGQGEYSAQTRVTHAMIAG